MNNEITKYSSSEILQILTDFYNCQSEFDPEVYKGLELSFETTIEDWREACDLIEPKKLAKYYHDLFKLKTPIVEFEDLLILEKKHTIRDFCEYISENANKYEIKPIISMGITCQEAAILKALIFKLKERGIKTEGIKPSSPFIPLFKKHSEEFITEVNKLAPGSLTKFEYRDNRIVRTGWTINGIFLLLLILVPFIWQFHWSLMILLGIELLIVAIGKQFKPEKEVIGGYFTIRDLIKGMHEKIMITAT